MPSLGQDVLKCAEDIAVDTAEIFGNLVIIQKYFDGFFEGHLEKILHNFTTNWPILVRRILKSI